MFFQSFSQPPNKLYDNDKRMTANKRKKERERASGNTFCFVIFNENTLYYQSLSSSTVTLLLSMEKLVLQELVAVERR